MKLPFGDYVSYLLSTFKYQKLKSLKVFFLTGNILCLQHWFLAINFCRFYELNKPFPLLYMYRKLKAIYFKLLKMIN